jgi:hypothetical protein
MNRRRQPSDSAVLLAMFPAVLILFWPLAVFHGHKAAAMETIWIFILVCAAIGISSFVKSRRG